MAKGDHKPPPGPGLPARLERLACWREERARAIRSQGQVPLPPMPRDCDPPATVAEALERLRTTTEH